MTRQPRLVALAAAGLLAVALGVGGLLEGVGFVTVLGFGLGSLALSVAAVCWRWSTATPANVAASRRFRVAFLAALVPGIVVPALAARSSPDAVFSWGVVTGVVLFVGVGLGLPLGVARTTRQQWTVVAALALLGELFVAAAVLDWNTHLESEGVATLLGLALVPIATLAAVGTYRLGARYGRVEGIDLPRRPRLAAMAVPWPAGAAALTVPRLLDTGLRWLPLVFGNLALYVYLALGAAFVAGAHVLMGAESGGATDA
jgi:predicted transporter